MKTTAKRIATVLVAAAFALPVGAGVAAANNDDYYHYYCDRDSRGYDWNYCWSHYKDRWQSEHGSHDHGRSW
ncbi:hypothetical protein [Nocardia inohanensis]|uniref:hypothetical protein n=1 Tax=Nocardia inohanensis TaxID=209246 RepID=UPI000836F361|nr:hypothetical protein [Nocardia inohanensis]